MKRTIFLPAIASAALCAVILGGQSRRNQALDARLTDLRRIASADLGQPPAPDADKRQNEPAPSGPADSQQRIESAAKDLSRRLSGVGDIQSGPVAFLRVFPAVLASSGHLRIDEAITVADQLGTGSIFPPEDAPAAARLLLYLLAAGQDPLKILERKDLELDSPEGSLEEALFAMLAQKDPDAALRWLDRQETGEALQKKRQFDIALGLLAHDPRRGLDFLAENPGILPGSGMGQLIAGLPMTGEARATLIEALPETRYAEIRPALAQLALRSGAATTSIAELRQQTEILRLGTDEIATFFRNNGTTLIQSDPANASAWMKEALPAGRYADSMALAIRQWTERDFNAAGTFLGTMENGTARDRSIQAFAQVVAWMEPESAATWAAEIGDPALREATFQSVGKTWNQTNPEAARQWMTRQGIGLPETNTPDNESK